MIFCRVKGIEAPAEYLAEQIGSKLDAGLTVLWLLSGGSAIELAVLTAEKLQGHNLKNLVVSLADERWGPVGHPDSNWTQLKKSGLSLAGARLEPVLKGKNATETAVDFETFLKTELAGAGYKVGLIGIGPDGHTFGILPASPAVDATSLVTDYQGPDYLRITPTPVFIEQLDEIVVYAIGTAKHKPLDDLEKELPLSVQPAQVLKRVKKLIIYNDYKGETQ